MPDNCCNYKCFNMLMFYSFVSIGNNTTREKKRKEANTIIDILRLILSSAAFGRLKSFSSSKNRQGAYTSLLEFRTTGILLTAPEVSYRLKECDFDCVHYIYSSNKWPESASDSYIKCVFASKQVKPIRVLHEQKQSNSLTQSPCTMTCVFEIICIIYNIITFIVKVANFI